MITLRYDNALAEADLAAASDGGILEGDELQTAILISLFTDALADTSEIHEGTDRAGWWGDAYADVDGDRIGSKLWIREQGKDLPALPAQIRADAEAALEWLITDGVATRIDVETERTERGRINLGITVYPTDGAKRQYLFEV